jgi:phosphoglycolate phosphatase
MDEKRNKKDEVIAFALDEMNVDAGDAVMIGDRKYDIEGGRKHGLMTVGVLYGFGDERELTDAGADHIAANIKELKKFLENI